MIFVTVGTTMPFDELLAEVDRLTQAGIIDEDVICQGGQSVYRIARGEQFVGRPSIVDLIEASSLVITHGGATVIQLLLAAKPFVAFPNPRAAGRHQESFLQQVAEVAEISWSRNVGDLEQLLAARREAGSAAVRVDFIQAGDLIRGMLPRRNRADHPIRNGRLAVRDWLLTRLRDTGIASWNGPGPPASRNRASTDDP